MRGSKNSANIPMMCCWLSSVSPQHVEGFVGSLQTEVPMSDRNCISPASRAEAISTHGTTASVKRIWRARRNMVSSLCVLLRERIPVQGSAWRDGNRGKGRRRREEREEKGKKKIFSQEFVTSKK